MNGFEIIQKIGEGAFSIVYKVRRKKDNMVYALKKVKLQKLKDKEKENALNEVRILASINSPFVIKYKEAFIEEKDKSLCIVIEYADKGDLYQKISTCRKMNIHMEEVDIWRTFIQMVKGLKCLHDLKILHRDLKSANIFLFNDGTAKIGDCNVSKVLYKGMGRTQTGTPYYASPEVWNEDPYDSKSDIWSLGVILFEMLTLHPPFRADNMDNLFKKVVKGQYGRISNKYSNDIVEIVDILLRVDPKDRPSCDEILKIDSVMDRIDFFKDNRDGFDDSLDEFEDEELLKTLRYTKNLIYLSEQLPDPNYKNTKNKNEKRSKNNNTIRISQNNFLPNITKRSNSKEDKKLSNSDSAKRILTKYKKNESAQKESFISHNNSHKNILIKTENGLSISKNKYNKEEDDKNDNKDYSIYKREATKNTKHHKFKSPKKGLHFFPNIYKNKAGNNGKK